MDTSNLVYVSQQPAEGAEPALAEPAFIIEHQGKLYLTRAVWEYDAVEGSSDAVKTGVRQIRELFDTHVASGVVRAVPVPPQPQVLHLFVDSSPGRSPDGDR